MSMNGEATLAAGIAESPPLSPCPGEQALLVFLFFAYVRSAVLLVPPYFILLILCCVSFSLSYSFYFAMFVFRYSLFCLLIEAYPVIKGSNGETALNFTSMRYQESRALTFATSKTDHF